MEVVFFNIQGFRGNYKYNIDDYATIINSKHNGVGKTTLYDCIKFLCDSSSVDKEEQAYFLNLHEDEGLFSITRDDVTHGFVLLKGQPPVFFKQVGDDDLERSDTNFPSAAQDIGILVINNVLLNIFSKEVNLFSESPANQNYQLVKEITTHQETEMMLSLLERSIQTNQAELNNLRAEKRGVDLQVESIPYYTCIDQLQALIDNNFYDDFELSLYSILESLDKLSEIPEFNFNSQVTNLIQVANTLDNIHATDFIPPKVKPLDTLQDLTEVLSRIQVVPSEQVLATPLEYLEKVSYSLHTLEPSLNSSSLDTKPIEVIETLLSSLSNLTPEPNIDVSSKLPAMLSTICVKIAEIKTAHNQELTFNKLAESRRAKLESTRVACPIRQEVYLVGGKCVY